MLHLAHISLRCLNLELLDVRGHRLLTFLDAVRPQGALVLPLKVTLRCLLSLCRVGGRGAGVDPSACWELNQLGLLTNAGNLHSEEQISPNQMPCLIRAVDTDNAVTGAGAIYLGLMSTDKSAG